LSRKSPRAAHERLGLGGAAHVLEQSREIVEAEPHVGMIWLKARLVDASARRKSGSARRVGSRSGQSREIIRVSRHIGMIRPIARLVDCERTAVERLGLGEAVRGLEPRREIVVAFSAAVLSAWTNKSAE
jgi:hypothetical protein